MRRAAKAPLVYVVIEAPASLAVAEAAEEAALPVAELAVSEAVVGAAELVAAIASAVALRVPHC